MVLYFDTPNSLGNICLWDYPLIIIMPAPVASWGNIQRPSGLSWWTCMQSSPDPPVDKHLCQLRCRQPWPRLKRCQIQLSVWSLQSSMQFTTTCAVIGTWDFQHIGNIWFQNPWIPDFNRNLVRHFGSNESKYVLLGSFGSILVSFSDKIVKIVTFLLIFVSRYKHIYGEPVLTRINPYLTRT